MTMDGLRLLDWRGGPAALFGDRAWRPRDGSDGRAGSGWAEVDPAELADGTPLDREGFEALFGEALRRHGGLAALSALIWRDL
jgi:hypothetical protein